MQLCIYAGRPFGRGYGAKTTAVIVAIRRVSSLTPRRSRAPDHELSRHRQRCRGTLRSTSAPSRSHSRVVFGIYMHHGDGRGDVIESSSPGISTSVAGARMSSRRAIRGASTAYSLRIARARRCLLCLRAHGVSGGARDSGVAPCAGSPGFAQGLGARRPVTGTSSDPDVAPTGDHKFGR